jgi:hypothetical protein
LVADFTATHGLAEAAETAPENFPPAWPNMMTPDNRHRKSGEENKKASPELRPRADIVLQAFGLELAGSKPAPQLKGRRLKRLTTPKCSAIDRVVIP